MTRKIRKLQQPKDAKEGAPIAHQTQPEGDLGATQAEISRRYPLGIDARRRRELEFAVRKLGSSSLWHVLLDIIYTYAALLGAGAACATAIRAAHALMGAGPGFLAVAVFAYAVTAIIIGRQQRVLELMVHDASHGGWIRGRRARSSRLANLLVAIPVMSTVQRYWQSHVEHHSNFGDPSRDPCRQRFMQIDGAMANGGVLQRMMAIAGALPAYMANYYSEIGSKNSRVLVAWVIWHAAVVVALDQFLVHDLLAALLMWLGFWLTPALSTLPTIRMIAEREEHDYQRSSSELGATYTNRGFWHRWLIHPWNDDFHWIHHAFPTVLQRDHRRVHKFLLRVAPEYRNSLHRTRLFQRL